MTFCGRITQISIHPIKSLAGIELQRTVVTPLGLPWDRVYMLVNPAGRYVTQRQLPTMVLVQPFFQGEQLWLRADGMDDIAVTPPALAAPVIAVTIWKDICQAQAAAPELNQWLTLATGSPQPLRLVALAPDFIRPGKTERFGPNTHTRFADAAPYLIATENSLAALNNALSTSADNAPIDMRRFRANIVFSGGAAFSEHQLRAIHLANGIRFGMKDHCQRCSIITVDPDTGMPSANATPFNQLSHINAMPTNNKAPAFGVNAVLDAGEGLGLTVGDEVWGEE